MSLLLSSLLIVPVLVAVVDAGSLSVGVRAVKRARRNNTLRPLSDYHSQALYSDDDVEYHGSDLFWVPKKGCKLMDAHSKYCKPGVSVYDPNTSTSSEPADGRFTMNYGTASVQGHYHTDVFSFGGRLRLKKPITFGLGEVMRHSDAGVLGLPSSVDPQERGNSVMHEAWRQKLLDYPIFTVYMRRCPDSEDCKDAGKITFGTLDGKNCQNVEGDVDVEPDTQHWIFNVTKLEMGGRRLSSAFKAMTDTGTSQIFAPSKYVDRMVRRLGAEAVEGGYIVDCNTDASLTFTINEQQYVVPSHQMLHNLHNGECQLLVKAHDEDGLWILGNPFTWTFCLIHDIQERIVGFAKVRN
ncbi:Peptidase A1 domain-containing protein [Aphelenchoides besseyi]|nr:Peptidase A1 domain-containing protein [Aphelenchoides besseyi]